MIQSKIFNNEAELNDFFRAPNLQVISIEMISQAYDTGLPTLGGNTFVSSREVIRVWYEERNVTNPSLLTIKN